MDNAAYIEEPSPWLIRFAFQHRPALHAFLMGTHPIVGKDSPILKLPVECIKHIFSFLRKGSFGHHSLTYPLPERLPTIKLVVIGPPGVGKTVVANRFVRSVFEADVKYNQHRDFLTKTAIYLGHNVYIEIWDTAGQER